MKKLKDLRAWCVTYQEETVVKQRDAQRTGNPHIATREAGTALALIHVIAEIDKALTPKEKTK